MSKPKPSAEPALVLQPSLDTMSIAEIEAHLTTVRARRMTAAIEYQVNANTKLDRANAVRQRQVDQQWAMIGADINRLDALIEKIEKRIQKVTIYTQEIAFNETMRVDVPDEASDE